MAKSHGRSSRKKPEQPLLSPLRETGDALEARSPTLDSTVVAARLREAAEAGGLLRPAGSSVAGLRDSGAELEEAALPFDLETGAARLQKLALARGLLRGSESADSASAVFMPKSPERERLFRIQESEQRSSNPPQDDVRQTDHLIAARVQFAKSAYSKMRDLGGPTVAGRIARMGRLTDDEISAALRYYVKPDLFATARSALQTQRVVALSGAAGIGKRTSAIALLREVTGGPLVILSPATSLRELASHEYLPGFSYLLLDWQDDQFQHDKSDLVYWQGIRDQLARAGAFMVATTMTWLYKEGAIPNFRWASPSPREILGAYLSGAEAESHLDEVIDRLPDRHELGFVVSLARALVASTDLNASLDAIRDDAAEQITSWFHNRSLDDIFAITVLAFMEGQSERVFQLMLQLLLESAERAGLIDVGAGRPDSLARAAAERLQADGLITRIKGSAAGDDLTVLTFRMPGFRRLVLAQLYSSGDTRFWDTVQRWLSSVVQLQITESSDELQLAVAAGLADLALTDIDQVVETYLNHWATGEFGWVGQMVSTYVLWWMSFVGTLAPRALSLVDLWANSADTSHKWTAVMALSGELGAAYPAEALQSLWRIIIARTEPLSTDATFALAQLFATLVSNGQNTGPVLRLLYEHLGSRNLSRITLSTALIVLSVRDPQSGLPAVALSIYADPASGIPLARLWIRVLSHTPGERQALASLVTALETFEQIGAAREENVRRFLDTLARESSPRAHRLLIRGLADWQADSLKSWPSTAANITPLLSEPENR